MPDAGWQELERAWRAAPGDQDLLQRAIAGRRRAGLAVPYELLQARRRPPREVSSRGAFDVWVEGADGQVDLVGQTGTRRPVQLPAHKTWWVSPAASSDMDLVGAELRALEAPGFSLAQARLTDEALLPLAEVPSLERLALLQCQGLSTTSLAALGEIRHLADLSLVYSGVGDPASLRAIGGLRALVELNLAGAPVDDEGATALASLPELAVLNLSGAALTDAGIAALARLPRLRDLRVQSALVTPAGLAALGTARELEVLHLDARKLRGDALAGLAAWPGLRELGLERCQGLRSDDWVGLRSAPRLRSLACDGARGLDDAAFAHVAALPELEELMLSGAPIRGACLRALRGRPLRGLILSDCQRLGADAVDALAELDSLRWLSLDACPLEWDAVESLRAALPGCEVEWTGAA